jgi:hypothetical protein
VALPWPREEVRIDTPPSIDSQQTTERVGPMSLKRLWRSLFGGPDRPLIVEPFLQIHDGKVYNPLTCRELAFGNPLWQLVGDLVQGDTSLADISEPLRDDMVSEGWIVENHGDLSRRYRLRGVSLETHTVCNHRCYFCPVSAAPRDSYFMPTEVFERIVGKLAEYHGPSTPTAPGSPRSGSTPSLMRDLFGSCRSTCRPWIESATGVIVARTSSRWCCATSSTPATTRWRKRW